jgi:hypothetical protein
MAAQRNAAPATVQFYGEVEGNKPETGWPLKTPQRSKRFRLETPEHLS